MKCFDGQKLEFRDLSNLLCPKLECNNVLKTFKAWNRKYCWKYTENPNHSNAPVRPPVFDSDTLDAQTAWNALQALWDYYKKLFL